jgi:hypothetical protein
MKRLFILLVLGISVAGALVALNSATQRTYSMNQEQVPSSITQEDLHLYPGASNVTREKVWIREHADLKYDVSATITDVLAFYTTKFLADGWTLARERNEMIPVTHHYYWTDRDHKIPWDLDMNVRVGSYDTVVNRDPGLPTTFVQISLYRAPVFDKIPLHPDATAVLTSTASYGSYGALRNASYITTASIDEVREFYKSDLAQQGWILLDEVDAGSGKGKEFIFNWYLGSVHSSAWANLYVQATPLGDGTSQVTLRLEGPLRPASYER